MVEKTFAKVVAYYGSIDCEAELAVKIDKLDQIVRTAAVLNADETVLIGNEMTGDLFLKQKRAPACIVAFSNFAGFRLCRDVR